MPISKELPPLEDLPTHNSGGKLHTSELEGEKTVVLSSTGPGKKSPHAGRSSLIQRDGRITLVLSVVLLGIILASGLAIRSTFTTHRNQASSSPPATSHAIVGQLLFLSSGQVQNNSSRGIADIVQLQLHLQHGPAAGKQYYAWLEPDQDNENAPALLLGTVTVQGQVGQLTYSDPLHTNLLASMSRLLVTEQDASNIPLVPSPNPGDWRYTAAIDNIKTSGTPYSPYSLLDHLRHLLSEEPTLRGHGLNGGVITWLQHDISKLVVWSISARDDWQADGNTDPGQIRRQLIRILFELYGDSHAPLELPANTAYAGLVDMPAAKIPLLPFGPLQNQFSIVDDIDFHLQGVAASPGISPAQQKAAANISAVINQLNTWLGRVLHDDRLLLAMNDQQLGQHSALSLLDDMQLNATYAFSGRIDQVTGNVQEGAQWVYQETQHLATIEVMPVP